MIKSKKSKKRFIFVWKVLISKTDRMKLVYLKNITGKSYSALGREALDLLCEKYNK